MVSKKLLTAILDSLQDPILMADTRHLVRYLNKAAVQFYEGGENLIGTSLLECHNERSQQMMVRILAEMHEGLTEELITDDEEHQIYMRVVRGPDGEVLGYYERYAPPKAGTALWDTNDDCSV